MKHTTHVATLISFIVGTGLGLNLAYAQLSDNSPAIETPRGVQPNHPFISGGTDMIDTSAGNATLRISIGQQFSVGPD